MTYFVPKFTSILNLQQLDFELRRNRTKVFKNASFIYPGDVLEIFFIKQGTLFKFEGLCLSIRKRFFSDPNTSVLLRTNIQNVGIECIFSYFYNRAYNFSFKDFKRKFSTKRRSKLYFLRSLVKLNSQA